MQQRRSRTALPIVGCLVWIGIAGAVDAQTSSASHASHPPAPAASAPESPSLDAPKLQQDVSKLQQQIRLLEQKLQASRQSESQPLPMSMQPGAAPASMSMMDDDMPMPKGNGFSSSGASMSRMGMPMRPSGGMMGSNSMMCMDCMGGMNSQAAMATPSELPGFPGQSHLYHIGATGFFLNHPEHITLTVQQQQSLANIKQQALMKQSDFQRQIDAAEQELWQLTGADQPQLSQIDKKVREIDKLKSDQRINFIRAVGEAANGLTAEQRQQLTGMAPAQSTTPPPMQMPNADKPKDSMGHM